MVGLVFHPRSPRYIAPESAAALAAMARNRATSVALLVDPDEHLLDVIVDVVDPGMIQLHGSESPERVAEIRGIVGRPVMKAIGIARREDLAAVPPYWGVADRLLLDAKPPRDAAYPGGHGQPFDWGLLDHLDPPLPFMLSGGLTTENVGKAVARIRRGASRLIGVDVSSGVESAQGVKDIGKIVAFIHALRAVPE